MTFGEKFWYYASLGWCYFVKIAVKKAMLEGLTEKAMAREAGATSKVASL